MYRPQYLLLILFFATESREKPVLTTQIARNGSISYLWDKWKQILHLCLAEDKKLQLQIFDFHICYLINTTVNIIVLEFVPPLLLSW